MADENTSAGTVAPVVPAVAPAAAVVTPVVATAAVTAPVTPASDGVDPAWIADRVSRATKAGANSLLKELGASSPEEAKAAITAAKAADQAKKTAETRATELAAQLTATQSQTERLANLAKEHASRMLMALTPSQQKAITDFAGEDAELQLRAIHSFAPTWAAQEEAAAKAAEEAAKAAKPAAAVPAQTTPAPGAPASVTPGSPPDHKSVYQATRATNPFAAAAYGLANPSVYEIKP